MKQSGKSTSGSSTKGSGEINPKYMMQLTAETLLSFFNWSLFVEFITVIWFFPLEEMDFTGWEICLIAIFSPILLSIGAVNRFVQRRNLIIRFVALMIGLSALYPYLIDKKKIDKKAFGLFNIPHVTRTFFVSVSVGLEWMAQCNRFNFSKSTVQRERTAYAYALGIALHTILRLPYISINPFITWANWIVFGVVLAVVSLFILYKFEEDSQSSIHNKSGTPAVNNNSYSIGVGFSGLVFINQLLFSTYGLVPRWVDLSPFPYGLMIILGLLFGIVISKKTSLITSINYHLAALAVGAVFGFCSGTVPQFIGLVGLLCGTYLAAYSSSLWVVIVERMNAAASKPKMFAAAIITYIVLLFWAIIVVSYKFLPWYLGANLLRERHQSMIIANILCIAVGVLSFRFVNGGNEETSSKEHSKRGTSTFPNREVLNLIFGLIVLTLLFSVNRAITHPTDARVQGSHYARMSNATHYELAAPTDIRAMIWTIHFGYDNFGRNSFPNITGFLKDNAPNVIGLLESDLSRVMTANRDLVEWLSYDLNMYSDFGPAPSENTWGCALLTIFPILSSKHVILPSPEGELACLIDAVIEVDKTPVNIIVTHFGNTEDKLDRELQAKGAAEIVGSNKGMPTIFLSYITTKMNSDNYNTIRSSGLEDTTNEGRYCEYVFYKNLTLHNFQRIDRGDITDTEGQMGHFTIKK